MENKKINLQEILDSIKNICSFNPIPDHFITVAMHDACRQVLELAAENADLNIGNTYLGNTKYVDSQKQNYISIDKQSILNTINQIQ